MCVAPFRGGKEILKGKIDIFKKIFIDIVIEIIPSLIFKRRKFGEIVRIERFFFEIDLKLLFFFFCNIYCQAKKF